MPERPCDAIDLILAARAGQRGLLALAPPLLQRPPRAMQHGGEWRSRATVMRRTGLVRFRSHASPGRRWSAGDILWRGVEMDCPLVEGGRSREGSEIRSIRRRVTRRRATVWHGPCSACSLGRRGHDVRRHIYHPPRPGPPSGNKPAAAPSVRAHVRSPPSPRPAERRHGTAAVPGVVPACLCHQSSLISASIVRVSDGDT